jgi:hypothetical protein
MNKALLGLLALVLALSATGAAARSDGMAPGLPAQVVDFEPDKTRVESYATTDFSGEQPTEGTSQWRVVHGTGNAAELWLTASATGRIYDLGGRYINYTDDDGQTWKSVRPLEPLVNGEGSVVVAPNGDILGVTWDPYAGDRVWTFKYTAATDSWSYTPDPFHTPFWDRPGIDVIPGDFTAPTGEKVSYITLIKGFPHELWHYSYDGLHYPFTISKAVDRQLTTPISEWLDVQADASFDYIQPLPVLGGSVTPLGDGKGVFGSLMFAGEDMRWHRFSLPEGASIAGLVQTDSRGRIHNVFRSGRDSVYRISANGGRTWSAELTLPGINAGDLKANAAAGVAAVSGVSGTQDVLYKVDISGAAPRLLRKFLIGKGDDCRCQGVGFYGASGGHRFDFHSAAILPDGRVAVSFMDSTTITSFPSVGLPVVAPALAVELPAPAGPGGESVSTVGG